MSQAVALSGGKDSTAMALRLAETEPDVERVYFCTPTGDELPEMVAHWERLEILLGQPLLRLQAKWTLDSLIAFYGSLPNWRQRWCTRQLKIEPCLAWLATQTATPVLCVGLRADEEERKGIFSEKVITRFPLREWGWGLAEVKGVSGTPRARDGAYVQKPRTRLVARCALGIACPFRVR